MKDVALAAWKWIAIGLLVGIAGGMLVLGVGLRRGTRTYRWRVALWALALSLLGAGGITVAGCENPLKPEPMCYDPVQILPDTEGQDLPDSGGQSLDVQDESTGSEDLMTCYKPGPDLSPPADTSLEPDVVIMCYEDVPPDLLPQPEDGGPADLPEMCYFAGDFDTDSTS